MNKPESYSILVVDDEETVRDLITKVLSIRGYSVSAASGYDEAMNLLENRHFDILLTDHNMPGRKGLDLLIESNKNYPDIVKILFTGMGGQDLYREAINRGAIFSLLEKPFSNDKLYDMIERAVEFRSQRIKELRKIKQLQQQYHTIFDYTADLIQCNDFHGNFIYTNPAWHHVLGYDSKESANITIFDLIHKDHKVKIREIIDRVHTGEMIDAFETVMISKKGLPVYIEGSATAQGQNDDVVAINFIFRDVTQRRYAEQEIQTRLKQETIIAKIAHLLANTEEPVFVYQSILEIVGKLANVDRTYIYSINEEEKSFEKVDTWCSDPAAGITQWGSRAPFDELPWIYEKVKNDDVVIFESNETMPLPDRIFMIKHEIKSNMVFPVRTGAHVVGILGFENIVCARKWDKSEMTVLKAAVDIVANAWTRQMEINARKDKEQEAKQSRLLVIRADRLAALGTMTAGIIHEITQPLNAINVSTQTILYGLSRGWKVDEAKVKNSLNLIVNQIKRMNDIITNMRAFSRDGLPAAREKANLNTQIQRVFTMLSEQMRAHGIDIELNLGSIPDNEMNTQQILQVILNLVTNARQALDECDIDLKKIEVTTSEKDENVILDVSDNGPGVQEGLREKIFDPFFTTKELGKGTGLGLSISAGIVNDHNGVLDVQSNDSGGATFIMRLPITQKT